MKVAANTSTLFVAARKKVAEIVTFRPDKDVKEMLSLAVDATGRSATDIINQALKEFGPAIVTRMRKQQDEAYEKLARLTEPKDLAKTAAKRGTKPKKNANVKL